MLLNNCCFGTGDRASINPRSDPRMTNLPECIPAKREGVADFIGWMRVSDLKDGNSGLWNESLVHHLFEPDSAGAILKISLPQINCRVKLIWLGNKEGSFSAKSCFNNLMAWRSYAHGMEVWERLNLEVQSTWET